MWRFLAGPGWSRGHPFSLARSPQSGEMQLAARIVGDGTARLASLQPGTRVLITRDRDAAHRMRAAEIAWLVAQRGLVHIALDGPRNARNARDSRGVPSDRIHHEQFSTEHTGVARENAAPKNGASS